MGRKLVDPNKLCMGCMREWSAPMAECPYCGFSINRYVSPTESLPLYEILNGKYLIGRVIGAGGFGITYIGWDFYQGKKVCIKEYFPRMIARRNHAGTNYTEQLSVSIYYNGSTRGNTTVRPEKLQQIYMQGLEFYVKEAENLSKFYLMPGIVSVRDFFYGNRTAYIVMEYIDGMDMKKYAKAKGGRLQADEVFGLLKDVLKALNEVHKKNIIHRDISPDNIMITRSMQAKLIDFGATRNYASNSSEPVLLKHGYAPPEQYSKDGNQGPWSDIYSMCATLYYLLTGVKIPSAKDRQKGETIPMLRSIGVPVSEAQDQAIKKGLSLDIESRFKTVAELYQELYGETI